MFKKWGGTVGKGIGKDEQGIVAPLLGVKPNNGGGLGFSTLKSKEADAQ